MKTDLRHHLVAGLAVGALALAACGDDDGGGSPQDEVADLLIGDLEGENLEGVEIDEDCIRDVTGRLSDEDAQALVDAGPDGDAEISAAGEEVGFGILECIDLDLSELDTDG